MALSAFNSIPEQSFAFYDYKDRSWTCYLHYLKTLLFQWATLRTYLEVLSQLLHTLLDTEYNTPNVFCLASYSTLLQVSGHPFDSCNATLPLLAHSDSVTTSWFSALVSLVRCSSATTASWLSPTGSESILSDYNTNLLPTAFLQTGLAFGVTTESNLTLACLDGLLRATVYRKPAFGCIAALTLIWTLNRPSFCVYSYTLEDCFLSGYSTLATCWLSRTFRVEHTLVCMCKHSFCLLSTSV